jgi:hypothetical protein
MAKLVKVSAVTYVTVCLRGRRIGNHGLTAGTLASRRLAWLRLAASAS